jgi:hypothetical protein
VLDHLVHLELVVPGAGLEEEVVREILDEVARREDVGAVPRPTLGVLRERACPPAMKWCGFPIPLTSARPASGARPSSVGLAPVSIVLIVVATSSTCPNSSVAIEQRRS